MHSIVNEKANLHHIQNISKVHINPFNDIICCHTNKTKFVTSCQHNNYIQLNKIYRSCGRYTTLAFMVHLTYIYPRDCNVGIEHM
mgnify:CR=1 FL=1